MIFIVDDNSVMRKTIKSMLIDIDKDIRECTGGTEAVRRFREEAPDWVLMDIRMKGLDGLEATRQILSIAPGARVIVVTNYDDEHLRDEARVAGAVGYVLKDDLTVLRRMLNGEP